jgi:hypothetical protein
MTEIHDDKGMIVAVFCCYAMRKLSVK